MNTYYVVAFELGGFFSSDTPDYTEERVEDAELFENREDAHDMLENFTRLSVRGSVKEVKLNL